MQCGQQIRASLLQLESRLALGGKSLKYCPFASLKSLPPFLVIRPGRVTRQHRKLRFTSEQKQGGLPAGHHCSDILLYCTDRLDVKVIDKNLGYIG